MSTGSPCPERTILTDLLTGTLPEAVQEQLTEHIGGCSRLTRGDKLLWYFTVGDKSFCRDEMRMTYQLKDPEKTLPDARPAYCLGLATGCVPLQNPAAAAGPVPEVA